MQSVSVIVINWNGEGFLKKCLSSVLSQSYRDLELLTVDSGSTDGSLNLLKREFPGLQVLAKKENIGFCKAFNEGCRRTKGEYVLALNSDTYLDPHFVEEAVGSMERDPEIGAISGKVLRFDGETIDSTGQFLRRDRGVFERGYNEKDTGRYEREGQVFSVCGAVAFYRREMLEDVSVGGEYFDEEYFAFYEDLDIAWRANLLGWRCFYNPRAIAYHSRGGTSPSTTKKFLGGYEFVRRPKEVKFHILKNRYLTMVKNESLASLLADLPLILSRELLLWGYVLIFCPALFLRLPAILCSALNAFGKRGTLQRRRRVSPSQIRGWIL